VAIVSRRPMSDVSLGLGDSADDPEARLVSATIAGVRVLSVYVPHGQRVGEEMFAHKLAWLKRLRAHLDAHYRPSTPLAACGDFNVAPEARDVFSPALWRDKVHYHVEARVALKEVMAFGLVDTFRLHHPGEGLYTWFDYQGRDTFERNLGLRIDHVFATHTLAEKCLYSAIDRAPRGLPHASDHLPMLSAFGEP
jgi:exodeoxyribonuclease III